MSSYFAFILKSESGGYFGFFPDFPEGFTQGDDIEECVFMLQDVLDICAEEYTRERRTLPTPSNIKTILEKAKEYIQETGYKVDNENPPLTQLFKIPNMETKPVKVMVSFPKNVLESIDAKASKLGMTRSGLLANSAMSYEV